MRRKPELAGDHEDQAVRFAWCVAFIATLAIAAILALAGSARALTLPVPAPFGPTAAVPVAEEDEEEAETSEDEEFEFEECEEDEECEEAGDEGAAPEQCLLSRAQTTVFATAGRDQVRLQIEYTTSSPTTVSFAYGLHGSKGSLYLGGEKKHLGSHGTLRLSKKLTDDQMAKVMAAKNFTVRLRVPAAPHYCQAFFDHELDVRHATPAGISWQQSE